MEFVPHHETDIISVEEKAENCVSGRSLSVYKDRLPDFINAQTLIDTSDIYV